MKILAFDPSLSCTGWALLRVHAEHPDGLILGMGYIQPDGAPPDDLAARILDLANGIGKRAAESAADLIVIETPATTGRAAGGQSFRGTAMTIPIYGAAVGACITVCGRECAKVRGVPSDMWTKGRGVPSSRGDALKTRRVEYVCRQWGVKSLGPKTYAGNVADAVLIARWAMWRDWGVT